MLWCRLALSRPAFAASPGGFQAVEQGEEREPAGERMVLSAIVDHAPGDLLAER